MQDLYARVVTHTHARLKLVLLPLQESLMLFLFPLQESNVYSCTCTVWRHVPLRQAERTCRHLWNLRGKDKETGRVGEQGIAKMEAAEDDLRKKQQRPPAAVRQRDETTQIINSKPHFPIPNLQVMRWRNKYVH